MRNDRKQTFTHDSVPTDLYYGPRGLMTKINNVYKATSKKTIDMLFSTNARTYHWG